MDFTEWISIIQMAERLREQIPVNELYSSLFAKKYIGIMRKLEKIDANRS